MSKEETTQFFGGFCKLKGRENYSVWKFQMKNLLKHDNLWYSIEGYPAGDGDTNEATRRRRDEKALSKINLMIEIGCLSHVMKAETAKEAWESLANAYEDKGLNRRVRLMRNLFSMKLENFSTMEAYVNEILSVSEQLAGIGKPIDDEYIAIIMLQGLPDEYEPMTMALEHSNTKITSDLVKMKLLQDKKWNSSCSGEQSAYFCKKKSFNKNKSNKPWCWNCKQVGHLKYNCPNKNIAEKSSVKKDFQKKSDKKSGDKALLTALGVSGTFKPTDWFVDSGATNHMSARKDWLCNFTEQQETEITVANNCKVYGKGVGDVPINSCSKLDTVSDITKITDVMYVPSLSANLLSVSATVKKGYIVVFDKNGCRILDDVDNAVKGDVKATASEVGGVYRLDMPQENVVESVSTNQYANLSSTESEERLWHRRLGHLNRVSLNLLKNGIATGINFSGDAMDGPPCVPCIEGKHARKPFKASKNKKLVDNKLDLIHTDLCGPMPVKSWSNKRYMLTFIDDHSRKIFVYFIETKDEVKKYIKDFVNMVENECEQTVKVIRSDNGTEYCNRDVSLFFRDRGIKHQLTTPYSPQQNGVAERYNRTIMEKTRSMIQDAACDQRMWAEAANTAVYLINRSPTKMLPGKTPEEIWNNEKKVNLSHLKVFGCPCYVHIPSEKRNKLQPKSKRLTFVGYCEGTKGYRLFDQSNQKIINSRDVIFLENEPQKFSEVNNGILTESEKKEDRNGANEVTVHPLVPILQETNEDIDAEINIQEEENIHLEEEIDEQEQENLEEIQRYPQRDRKKKQYPGFVLYQAVLEPDNEPVSVSEALASSEKHEWQKAMQNEINCLHEKGVWSLVDKPDTNINIVKNKWVFKAKKNAEGETVRYRARLVAKGFTQQEGVDYTDTFSPVIRHSSLRILFALSAAMNLEMDHLDVEAAFLNSDLDEKIYMSQPEGFVQPDQENKVCLLKKAIYGLKQSSRAWNITAKDILLKLGYKESKYEPCLFYKTSEKGIVLIALYVDDFFFFYDDLQMVNETKSELAKNFTIKDLGPISFALGMKIERDRDNLSVKLSQKQYILSLLEKFGILDAKPVGTPLDCNTKFSTDEEYIDNVPYQQLIGSLMYLCVMTRPDIMFAVSYLSQFNINHTKEHWTAAKRVLRYLKGTMDLCLTYSGNDLSLKGYVDADWANNPLDRKSFTGYAFTLANCAISWECRKQSSIALSSTEAEYMAITESAKEAVYLLALLKELLDHKGQIKLLVNNYDNMILFNDNQSAQKIASNPIYHRRTKHIDVRYHYIRDVVTNGQIKLEYMPSTDMISDICTKPLPVPKHKFCTTGLGLL